MQLHKRQVSCQEATYNAVKLRGLVAHRSTLCILMLARTELAKVFCSFRDSVTEELHFYATKRFSYSKRRLSASRLTRLVFASLGRLGLLGQQAKLEAPRKSCKKKFEIKKHASE
jgi:hypothetical protein